MLGKSHSPGLPTRKTGGDETRSLGFCGSVGARQAVRDGFRGAVRAGSLPDPEENQAMRHQVRQGVQGGAGGGPW